MMPRPQSRAQKAAAVANRKKFELAPGDRAAVTQDQLMAQAAPDTVSSESPTVAQPQLFSETQNVTNAANLEFFALAPADRAANYAATHPIGICCLPNSSIIAFWNTWNTNWNLCNENWGQDVYVV